MRFDLSKPLVNYSGQLFTRPVTEESGAVRQEPLVLKSVLESACLNADPNQHSDGTKKMVIFGILMKVHQARPFANLSAEEVSVLKDLIGRQLTVAAVGAVYAALEQPVYDNVSEASGYDGQDA